MENVHTNKQKVAYPSEKNKVLNGSLKSGNNFFYNDLIFHDFFQRYVSAEGKKYIQPILEKTGKIAAGTQMNEWAAQADKNGPQFVRRNVVGEDIFDIQFHPAYERLMEVAVDSQMMRVKWEPELRKKFKQELHTLGFSSGFLFSLTEQGQYCPLCMTDGVARLIDRFCSKADQNRLLPHIYTKDLEQFFTGAMYLTEKTGGSDVGANIVVAEHSHDNYYRLYGEKWFCSNANGEIMFVLARTQPEVKGTKGLSIFLVEKFLPDGSRNPIEILRLKDKLGVRSMASAECNMNGAYGKLVGEEFQGFKIMVEMINLSRLYNSLASITASRRALAEAYTFISRRTSFGRPALQHGLIRDKLFELSALHAINFYMTWKSIRLLDAADNGNEKSAQFLRLLTPMVKKWSAETAVYITRESMELMGGLGYIEDGILPRLMRDVMVLPIWEGAGNVMILDMLRASIKENALHAHFEFVSNQHLPEDIRRVFESLKQESVHLTKLADKPDELAVEARSFFNRFIPVLQFAILDEYDKGQAWISGAKEFLSAKIKGENTFILKDLESLKDMIGWKLD